MTENKWFLIILGAIAGLMIAMWMWLTFVAPTVVEARQETCPDSGMWIKIDSGDLSLYPVSNAVEYCFKAGNFIESDYPDGGFGQDGSCNNGIQYCELSHWSYKIGEMTPTPTIEPTNTPTLTPTPTNEPTQSPTPSVSPTPSTITPTATPKPTDKPINDDGCCSSDNNNPVDENGNEVILEPAPLSK